MTNAPVLIADQWRVASSHESFSSTNPTTKEQLAHQFPVSHWEDCEAALAAAHNAFAQLCQLPGERIAEFLEKYADLLDERKGEIVAMAHLESALPISPRLGDVEFPRTTGQLRQAAAAAREGSWKVATIDTAANIRSRLAPLGPVAVFGPNNFPLAFNSIAGGDFAAAIATGCPVIAKANTSHPTTTQLLAEQALKASQATNMPAGTVQLLYRTTHADGEKLVADPRIGATAYTGARGAGLTLKAAADAAGKPIYLELSSVNPVVILPGALKERGEQLAGEFSGSCLMGTGQFCTNPGLVLLLAGEEAATFINQVAEKFAEAPVGTLLSEGVQNSLAASLSKLKQTGAEEIAGGSHGVGEGFSHANTLLKVDGARFLANPQAMQTEAFGNASLVVVASDIDQATAIIEQLEGNLTGCVYSDTTGSDDAAYNQLEPALRRKVGRLLNDKMPTGVAVSAAMNHGGPYPATGHPGFTAVGIPTSLSRFGMLQCYDNVRPERLAAELQDANPNGEMWRRIDGNWTKADV